MSTAEGFTLDDRDALAAVAHGAVPALKAAFPGWGGLFDSGANARKALSVPGPMHQPKIGGWVWVEPASPDPVPLDTADYDPTREGLVAVYWRMQGDPLPPRNSARPLLLADKIMRETFAAHSALSNGYYCKTWISPAGPAEEDDGWLWLKTIVEYWKSP